MTDNAAIAASTTFNLVPEHVSEAGRYVQATAQSLISGLRSASADVNALETTWRGTAATAYATAWDEVHRGALDVFEALADMADLLGVVVDRTAATDTSNAAAVNSLDLP
ncbi:WXG100 family type VII secretion target [Nocardia sp. NPDC046473]|uniref:WXG100 family type VII secretion target n=1 Tax=Nocardia sp. NPDC046473 TaxID=3155733 RepID=UPI00340A9F28